MKDFKLNTESDIETSSYDILLVDGVAEIEQRVRTRLKTIIGEWEYDKRMGLPFVGTGGVFDSSTPLVFRKAMVRKYIADTRGIKFLSSFDATIGEPGNTLVVSYAAICYDNNEIVFSGEIT